MIAAQTHEDDILISLHSVFFVTCDVWLHQCTPWPLSWWHSSGYRGWVGDWHRHGLTFIVICPCIACKGGMETERQTCGFIKIKKSRINKMMASSWVFSCPLETHFLMPLIALDWTAPFRTSFLISESPQWSSDTIVTGTCCSLRWNVFCVLRMKEGGWEEKQGLSLLRMRGPGRGGRRNGSLFTSYTRSAHQLPICMRQ